MYWLYAVRAGVWGLHHVPAKLLKTSASLGGSDRFEGENICPSLVPLSSRPGGGPSTCHLSSERWRFTAALQFMIAAACARHLVGSVRRHASDGRHG